METIIQRYKDQIAGVLRSYDRMVFTGTLPQVGNAKQMTSYLYGQGIRIFDYPQYAMGIRDKIKKHVEELAQQWGIEIEYIRQSGVRKEDLIEKKIKERGNQERLIHILSVLEGCTSFKPWHDKASHKTYLKTEQGKCLVYYFYFKDAMLGHGYLRLPTYLPLRLQVYFNGHGWLEKRLQEKGIGYRMMDNAFVEIDHWGKAQKLADGMNVSEIHRRLDKIAYQYCPVYKTFKQRYHWSIMQCEYATDIVFKRQQDLQPVYAGLINKAIQSVKPDNISTFLGKRIYANYEGEVGNNYHVRIEGSRIKHNMGNTSIKLYDKFGHILRVETTVNDVTFFKHYRRVEHRDGSSTYQDAAIKKNIYSLTPLQEILNACNSRYIEFISTIEDNTIGQKKLEKLTVTKKEKDRNYRGINPFNPEDKMIIQTITRGEFNIHGLRSQDLLIHLKGFSKNKISRVIKRLRVLGIIKKVANSYRYYLTTFGKCVIISIQKLINMVFIPELATY